MPNTVVRTGDPTDQRRKSLRSANSTIAIAYVSCAVVAAWIIWKGGFIGLIVVAILVAIIAIWMCIEGAIERMRFRRLMRSGRFSLPVKNAMPITGSVDAWLLLADGFRAAAVDRSQGALWFFPSPKRAHLISLSAVPHLERGTRRTWYGRTRDVLRLSDQFIGASTDIVVREGDLDAFLRAAGEARAMPSRH